MGCVDFTGRSSCSDYWFAYLVNVLINDGSVAGPLGTIAILLILAMLIYGLAVVLPFTAIQARRLRDAGYTWPYIFTIFIPFVGWIILLVLLCKPTKVESPFNNS